MPYKPLIVGADHFLALKWANYAFELYQSQQDHEYLYHSLKAYLDLEIDGPVTSRKVSNHLKSLWLSKDDPFEHLRCSAIGLPIFENIELMPILHLGMAINVYPVYHVTLKAIGLLDRIIQPIPKRAIVERVMETFANPSTIPRVVARVMQTLEDWKLIEVQPGTINLKQIIIKDQAFSAWLLSALLTVNNTNGIVLSDLPLLPEKLGVQFTDPRSLVQLSPYLTIYRDPQGLEYIKLRM